MRIGLDFDGVIADCLELKSITAKRLFNKDIPSSKFKKEHVVDGGLLTLPQYRFLQDVVYGTFATGLKLSPIDGAIDGIGSLLDEGHSVRVVTTRSGLKLDVARTWAENHGLALEFTGVGHGNDKIAATDGLHLFVDDDLDKLEPLVETVPHRLLFSWEYNKHLDETGVALRVSSWQEIVAHVSKLTAAQKNPLLAKTILADTSTATKAAKTPSRATK